MASMVLGMSYHKDTGGTSQLRSNPVHVSKQSTMLRRSDKNTELAQQRSSTLAPAVNKALLNAQKNTTEVTHDDIENVTENGNSTSLSPEFLARRRVAQESLESENLKQTMIFYGSGVVVGAVCIGAFAWLLRYCIQQALIASRQYSSSSTVLTAFCFLAGAILTVAIAATVICLYSFIQNAIDRSRKAHTSAEYDSKDLVKSRAVTSIAVLSLLSGGSAVALSTLGYFLHKTLVKAVDFSRADVYSQIQKAAILAIATIVALIILVVSINCIMQEVAKYKFSKMLEDTQIKEITDGKDTKIKGSLHTYKAKYNAAIAITSVIISLAAAGVLSKIIMDFVKGTASLDYKHIVIASIMAGVIIAFVITALFCVRAMCLDIMMQKIEKRAHEQVIKEEEEKIEREQLESDFSAFTLAVHEISTEGHKKLDQLIQKEGNYTTKQDAADTILNSIKELINTKEQEIFIEEHRAYPLFAKEFQEKIAETIIQTVSSIQNRIQDFIERGKATEKAEAERNARLETDNTLNSQLEQKTRSSKQPKHSRSQDSSIDYTDSIQDHDRYSYTQRRRSNTHDSSRSSNNPKIIRRQEYNSPPRRQMKESVQGTANSHMVVNQLTKKIDALAKGQKEILANQNVMLDNQQTLHDDHKGLQDDHAQLSSGQKTLSDENTTLSNNQAALQSDILNSPTVSSSEYNQYPIKEPVSTPVPGTAPMAKHVKAINHTREPLSSKKATIVARNTPIRNPKTEASERRLSKGPLRITPTRNSETEASKGRLSKGPLKITPKNSPREIKGLRKLEPQSRKFSASPTLKRRAKSSPSNSEDYSKDQEIFEHTEIQSSIQKIQNHTNSEATKAPQHVIETLNHTEVDNIEKSVDTQSLYEELEAINKELLIISYNMRETVERVKNLKDRKAVLEKQLMQTKPDMVASTSHPESLLSSHNDIDTVKIYVVLRNAEHNIVERAEFIIPKESTDHKISVDCKNNAIVCCVRNPSTKSETTVSHTMTGDIDEAQELLIGGDGTKSIISNQDKMTIVVTTKNGMQTTTGISDIPANKSIVLTIPNLSSSANITSTKYEDANTMLPSTNQFKFTNEIAPLEKTYVGEVNTSTGFTIGGNSSDPDNS